jgi:hypothetical protein
MPSTRYTIRLPPALDAAVQEHILTTRTPFAVLIREALSAYLADTAPTEMLTGRPTSAPTPTDLLKELQVQVAALTTRVEILEMTERRQDADRGADTALTVVLPIKSPAVTHKVATTQSARGQNSI